MNLPIVKLDKEEITQAIIDGNNCSGRRWLAVTPGVDWGILWADNNRQFDPWPSNAAVIAIPALWPDGDGKENEMLQDIINNKELKIDPTTDPDYDPDYADGGLDLSEWMQEKHPETYAAYKEVEVDFLVDTFLSACNGEGSELNDPNPWGMAPGPHGEYNEANPQPAKFEYDN